MANKKISELTETINLTPDDYIPVVQDGTNKKVKVKHLKGSDNLTEDYVLLKGDDGALYRCYVVNGEPKVYSEEELTAEPVFSNLTASSVDSEWKNARQWYDGLIINQIYGGGSMTTADGGNPVGPVSHSFIELYNLKESTLNLNGVYLWIRPKSGSWQSLALKGTIPPYTSFLIRCKQCAGLSDALRVNITDYDMSWDIQLPTTGFSAFLQITDNAPGTNENPIRTQTVVNSQGTTVIDHKYYIDLLGAGGKSDSETIIAYEKEYLHCMDKNTGCRRIDFANSGKNGTVGTNAVSAGTRYMSIGSNRANIGSNRGDCEAVDFSICNLNFYKPRSTKDGMWTLFIDKTSLNANCPNALTMAYGVNGETTRSFTWQTLQSELGVLKYRKVGETVWIEVPSQKENTTMNGIPITIHRATITGLEANASYEYIAGEEGKWSDVAIFNNKTYSKERGDHIRFLWTSDQQGWG